MAQLARKLEVEDFMDERIARLETHTEHMREDIRRIETKINNKIDPKLDALTEKIDALKDSLVTFQLETKDQLARLLNARWADKVWSLLIGAAILGVMARGFKWI